MLHEQTLETPAQGGTKPPSLLWFSYLLLIFAIYFIYALVQEILDNRGFLYYLLFMTEMLNELLMGYWAKKGIEWADVGSLTLYARLYRVSIGLVTCECVFLLIELVAISEVIVRWQCVVSLGLRIGFYFLTKRCIPNTETLEGLQGDHLEIPNFSYARFTDRDEREHIMEDVRKVSRDMLPVSRESSSGLTRNENENIRRSYVFS